MRSIWGAGDAENSHQIFEDRLPNGGLAPSFKGSQARLVLVVLAILAGQDSYLLRPSFRRHLYAVQPIRLFLSSIRLL